MCLYTFCLRVLKSASEATEVSSEHMQPQPESWRVLIFWGYISTDGKGELVDKTPQIPILHRDFKIHSFVSQISVEARSCSITI